MRVMENHGMSNSPEYWTWHGVIQRCTNPNATGYSNYGGRGISVSERWKNSFINFLKDMGKKPSNNSTIERRDVNGNYEASNCYWINSYHQKLNTRLRRDNTLGLRGVAYHKRGYRHYQARPTIFNKTYSFGYFDTAEEAAYVRDQVMYQIHGEIGNLNFELTVKEKD